MREVESVWRRFGGIRNTVVLAPGTPQPLCQPLINVPIYDDLILLYIGNGCETPKTTIQLKLVGFGVPGMTFPRNFLGTSPRSEREFF